MLKTPLASGAQHLLSELRELIDQARRHVAQTANSAQTLLYWHMGLRIGREVLKGQRADYGEQIVATLSTQLVQEYGRGFNRSALARMVKFSEAFPDEGIVATLSQQLSWSHFIELLPLQAPLEREYYAELCRVERWSVRTLRERIASQLYLRTAIARQPEAVVQAEIGHLRAGGQMTSDLVFRDPYMILCAAKDAEQVELLDLHASHIRVAEYVAHIPDTEMLQVQLHRAVQMARERAAPAALPPSP